MSDEYFERVALAWLPAVEQSTGSEQIKRWLVLFAKEVSRDTRHQAADIAQASFRDIMNMEVK